MGFEFIAFQHVADIGLAICFYNVCKTDRQYCLRCFFQNSCANKPKDIFDVSATNTVLKWKFEPATYMGKKVKVWATQKITFKLN